MLTPIALAQALLPGMAERQFGRIINITSARCARRSPASTFRPARGRASPPFSPRAARLYRGATM